MRDEFGNILVKILTFPINSFRLQEKTLTIRITKLLIGLEEMTHSKKCNSSINSRLLLFYLKLDIWVKIRAW